jgi:hypothetical protein
MRPNFDALERRELCGGLARFADDRVHFAGGLLQINVVRNFPVHMSMKDSRTLSVDYGRIRFGFDVAQLVAIQYISRGDGHTFRVDTPDLPVNMQFFGDHNTVLAGGEFDNRVVVADPIDHVQHIGAEAAIEDGSLLIRSADDVATHVYLADPRTLAVDSLRFDLSQIADVDYVGIGSGQTLRYDVPEMPLNIEFIGDDNTLVTSGEFDNILILGRNNQVLAGR